MHFAEAFAAQSTPVNYDRKQSDFVYTVLVVLGETTAYFHSGVHDRAADEPVDAAGRQNKNDPNEGGNPQGHREVLRKHQSGSQDLHQRHLLLTTINPRVQSLSKAKRMAHQNIKNGQTRSLRGPA